MSIERSNSHKKFQEVKKVYQQHREGASSKTLNVRLSNQNPYKNREPGSL